MNGPQTPKVIQFDYENQAWIVGGLYERCGHPEEMACGCYGRHHAGENASPSGSGICPDCEKDQPLTPAGLVDRHWIWEGNHATLCIGINTSAAQPWVRYQGPTRRTG